MTEKISDNSIIDKLLFLIADLSVRFYSGSTREWAEETITSLEGPYVREITREEAKEVDSLPDRTISMTTVEEEEDDEFKVLAGDERQRGLTALVIALKYRLSHYWLIFLVPIVIHLFSSSLGHSISLMNLGIYFDLFGAIIVVRGLYRTPSEVDYESALTLPENPVGDPVDRLVAAVETIDSMFGSMLLTFGFALQLIAFSNILLVGAILLLILIVWWGLK